MNGYSTEYDFVHMENIIDVCDSFYLFIRVGFRALSRRLSVRAGVLLEASPHK